MPNPPNDVDRQSSFHNFIDAAKILISRLKQADDIMDAAEREVYLRQIVDELQIENPVAFKSLTEADRSGFALLLVFQSVLASVLVRPDLSEGDKTEASSDAEDFYALFELFQEMPRVNCDPTAVFQFASKALLIGLQAGLRPDEVRELRERLPAELGRAGGKKSGASRKANRPWVLRATELAIDICSSELNLSDEKVVGKILDRWGQPRTRPPGTRTLTKLVSELRASGNLPQRSGSPQK